MLAATEIRPIARTPRRARFRALGLLAAALVLLSGVPALAGTISLTWDPVSDPDLAGYRLHYGTSPGALDRSQDAGLATSATLTSLDNCVTWYVAVRAYDTGGLESAADSNLVRGFPRPLVSSVSPSSIEAGETLTITVSGFNFDPGVPGDPSRPAATVELSNPDLIVRDVTVDACGQVRVLVEARADASAGRSDLTVLNPDISHDAPSAHPQVFGTMANALSITEAEEPSDTTPPSVAGYSPAAGASDVAADVRPTVTFDEPVDPASVAEDTVYLVDAAGARIPQVAGWPTTSGSVVTIRPASALEAGATYRIRVVGGTAGVADLAGNEMVGTETQTPGFTVEGDEEPPQAAPNVASSSPAAGEKGVSLGTTEITISFDRDMSPLAGALNREQLHRAFSVRPSEGGGGLPQTSDSPYFRDGGYSVVIRLDAGLHAGGRYVSAVDLASDDIVAALEAADRADFAMEQSWQNSPAWQVENAVAGIGYQPRDGFEAASGTLTMVTPGDPMPQNNTNVPCASEFRVTFAVPVLARSVAGAITIQRGRQIVPLAERPTLSKDRRIVTLTPAEPLEPGVVYYIQIGGGRTGVRLDAWGRVSGISERALVRVPFATELATDDQDGKLGVAR